MAWLCVCGEAVSAFSLVPLQIHGWWSSNGASRMPLAKLAPGTHKLQRWWRQAQKRSVRRVTLPLAVTVGEG